MRGSITLAQVAERAAVLAMACTQCERAGEHGVDALVARHGPLTGVPELLRSLSAGCPMRQSASDHDLCGIHCPGLSALFLAG